jgi:hypothetical protein
LGLAAVVVLALAAPAAGQSVEASPFVGYRFGGSFFESVTGQEVDLDGARTLGAMVNVPLFEDLQIEALFTHQAADVVVPSAAACASSVADGPALSSQASSA